MNQEKIKELIQKIENKEIQKEELVGLLDVINQAMVETTELIQDEVKEANEVN